MGMVAKKSLRKIKMMAMIAIVLSHAIYIFHISSSAEQDFYPYFGWRLFASVPQQIETYQIRVFRLNNEKYDKGIYFFDIKDKESMFYEKTFPFYRFQLLALQYGRDGDLLRQKTRALIYELYPKIQKITYEWEYIVVDPILSYGNNLVVVSYNKSNEKITEVW